jgi:hypothetical protein
MPETPGITSNSPVLGHTTAQTKKPASQSNFAGEIAGVSQTNTRSAASDTTRMPHQDAANTLQGLKELYSDIFGKDNSVANMTTPGDVIAALNRARTTAPGDGKKSSGPNSSGH